MSEISDRIEGLLKERGLRRVDIVNGTGLPESTVRSWSNSNKSPSAVTLQKVAEFFHVSLEYLITGEDTEQMSKEERELLMLFRRFDERDKDTVLDLCRSLNSRYSDTRGENISAG